MCQRHGARESKRLFLCIDIFSTSVLYCLCSDQILSELIPNTWVIPIEQMGNGNISRLNKASQSWSSTLIPDPQLMKLPTFSPTTQSQNASRAPFILSKLEEKKIMQKGATNRAKRGRTTTAASRDFPNHNCASSAGSSPHSTLKVLAVPLDIFLCSPASLPSASVAKNRGGELIAHATFTTLTRDRPSPHALQSG